MLRNHTRRDLCDGIALSIETFTNDRPGPESDPAGGLDRLACHPRLHGALKKLRTQWRGIFRAFGSAAGGVGAETDGTVDFVRVVEGLRASAKREIQSGRFPGAGKAGPDFPGDRHDQAYFRSDMLAGGQCRDRGGPCGAGWQEVFSRCAPNRSVGSRIRGCREEHPEIIDTTGERTHEIP